MSRKNKIIIILLVFIVVILGVSLGASQAFLEAEIEGDNSTDISLKSCTRITFSDKSSINLTNTAPMSVNEALRRAPYEFSVASKCNDGAKFKINIGIVNDELSFKNIRFRLYDNADNILSEGHISDLVSTDVTENDLKEISQINGKETIINNSFILYGDKVLAGEEKKYKLYLWVDENVYSDTTMNKTFEAQIYTKTTSSGVDFSDICQGTLFARCIAENYRNDDIIYHDGSLANDANDGSYRYYGLDPNNYVCFGESNYYGCRSQYLYRIIGVFDNKLKLIKADYDDSRMYLGSNGDQKYNYSYKNLNYRGSVKSIYAYFWNNANGDRTNSANLESKANWKESKLNTINLNQNALGYFNENYQSMIEKHVWQVGGGPADRLSYYPANAKSAYDYELGDNSVKVGDINCTRNNESTKSTCELDDIYYQAKIGLMYASDYYYAADPKYWSYPGSATEDHPNKDGKSGSDYDYGAAVKSNWLYLGCSEWTITRVTNVTGQVSAIAISSYGQVTWNNVAKNAFAARPVFYLNDNITLVSGNGTKNNPYHVDIIE